MKCSRIALLMSLFLSLALGVVLSQVPDGTTVSAQKEPPSSNAIQVGEDRQVVAGGTELPLVEPHVAVNPREPNNLIAGAMVSKPDGSFGVAAFSSFDGGRTWQRHDFAVNDGGDVWAVFLADGTALLSTLAGEKAELQIFRSADGGRTWHEKPSTLGFGHDHPTLLVDRLSKQFAGSLYAVSAVARRSTSGQLRSIIHVARSTDGGVTFLESAHVIASNLSYEAHNPALLSDGTLLVPFADHHRLGSRRRLERQRDWLITSADGGKTFSQPLFISESCNGVGGWSSLAVNTSGVQFRDRIYHVCSGQQFDGIQIRYSDDAGETWSDPVRADHPGNVTPYARTPAINVNGDGVVGVAWYDGRTDPSTIKGSFRCHEIYFTASLDGGKTFLPEVKISAQKSCPAQPKNVATALRFPAGGEYMGLDTVRGGSFHLLWSDARSGIYQLRTAAVKVLAKQ
jgi:BNR/Asp-box repeat